MRRTTVAALAVSAGLLLSPSPAAAQDLPESLSPSWEAEQDRAQSELGAAENRVEEAEQEVEESWNPAAGAQRNLDRAEDDVLRAEVLVDAADAGAAAEEELASSDDPEEVRELKEQITYYETAQNAYASISDSDNTEVAAERLEGSDDLFGAEAGLYEQLEAAEEEQAAEEEADVGDGDEGGSGDAGNPEEEAAGGDSGDEGGSAGSGESGSAGSGESGSESAPPADSGEGEWNLTAAAILVAMFAAGAYLLYRREPSTGVPIRERLRGAFSPSMASAPRERPAKPKQAQARRKDDDGPGPAGTLPGDPDDAPDDDDPLDEDDDGDLHGDGDEVADSLPEPGAETSTRPASSLPLDEDPPDEPPPPEQKPRRSGPATPPPAPQPAQPTGAGSIGSSGSQSALEQYGRDLTAAARNGELGEVIGRDEEIQRTVDILHRKGKANPVLVGEAGVGKTAITEGLARLPVVCCSRSKGMIEWCSR